MSQKQSIELLAPAGDIDKLKVAISYGADAVYIGGQVFGLRSAAGNFSKKEMEQGISYARKLGKKVYLTVNTFPTEDEIEGIAHYFENLKSLDLDALIVADPGVFSLAREITPFDIHLSTQASISNSIAVRFWKERGVKRIVLGREVSINEAKDIMQDCDIELEMFIHGSMCMSYSGKCTISNYTANRDANRGGCVNSCRWEYSISSLSDTSSHSLSYLMNSKDLWAVHPIREMIESGIRSLKIEGRMKSHLYLSTVVSVYRQIIDSCLEGKKLSESDIKLWEAQLSSVPNRGFSDGFLTQQANKDSVSYNNVKSRVRSNYLGTVREVGENFILLQVKNPFKIGDTLSFRSFNGEKHEFKVNEIKDLSQESIAVSKPNSLVYLNKDPAIQVLHICSLLKAS